MREDAAWQLGNDVALCFPQRYTRHALPPTLFTAVSVLLLSSCSLLHHQRSIAEPVELIAVMPIERQETPSSATKGATDSKSGQAGESPGARIGLEIPAADARPPAPPDATSGTPPAGPPRIEPGASRVLTAQIYGVLASSSEWRFVPDLTVVQALPKIPPSGDLAERARALGKAVGADAVLFGTVSRYVERVGSEYGAQEPAAVAFKLQLISVASGTILWTGSFDQVQEPLSSNLFNWWQFWRGGPKWFSAEEFSHLGVEHEINDLAQQMGY